MNAGSKALNSGSSSSPRLVVTRRAAAQLLEAAGVACVICRDLEELCSKLMEGAGAALIAEEAFIARIATA